MKIRYVEDRSDGVWWCESHQRFATHIRIREEDNGNPIDQIRHCNPNLGGIMLPCNCIHLEKSKEMNTIQKLTENCPREDCSLIDHGGVTTLAYWIRTYDKNGNLQGEDPNTTTTRMECRTCGKQWQIASGGGRKEEHITLIKV